MNWLLSIVFWSAMFLEFEFLGFAVNQFARYRTGIIKNWLTGYFAFFLLTMPLGYVFQLTCGSWNLYFVLQALIVLAANAGVFLGLRKAGLLRPLAAEIRAVFTKEGLRQALSENWFGLVWIGICMFFLISSQLGVMETAYDEYYYIGKMVNLQGADQMFMEEYHNGALLASPAFDPARFLNTYELAYAWLASLFGIGIPFFARITMSAMQYVLLFFLAKETAACFVLRKYAQFATAGFLVFVLPDPFWRGVRNLLNVGLYSYDLWQFQLTPYFGSSVVRMSGFFALFHFSVPLLKKMQWKQVLWVGAVSAVLLGYSTCVLPVFGMFALGIILAKLTVTGCDYWQQGDKRKAGLYLAGAVLLFAALLAVNKFIGLPDTELYQDYARAIGDFMQGHYIYDFSVLTAVFVLAAAMLFCRNRIQVSFVLVLAFLYFSIVKLGLFNLVARLGFGYEFVTLRAIAGVQTMLYFTAALLLMKIWRWFRLPEKLMQLLAGTAAAGICIAYFASMSYVQQDPYLGSGISRYGWDFSRPFRLNSDMLPDTSVEIGNYFNTLPYGNYWLLTDHVIPNESESFDSQGFLLVSNRIQVMSPAYPMDWETDTGSNIIDFIAAGEGNAESALRWMKNHDVSYALVFSQKAKDELAALGCPAVLESTTKKGDTLFLMEIKPPVQTAGQSLDS